MGIKESFVISSLAKIVIVALKDLTTKNKGWNIHKSDAKLFRLRDNQHQQIDIYYYI